MQEKYMVIDSLEGINSEIEKFGNMIPQTENKELKQTLKEMRNKCEMSQEQLAQIATAKNYYISVVKLVLLTNKIAKITLIKPVLN